MPPPIRNPKDFWIGAIYLATGTAGLLIGRGYNFGTAARMGPGYFPTVVSSLLIVFGIVAVGRSLVRPGDPVGPLAWKTMLLIVGASVAFGLLLQPAGLIVALTVLVLTSAAASNEFRLGWLPAFGLVALVAFCALVFVKGLGVPMPLVGPWLQDVTPSWLAR